MDYCFSDPTVCVVSAESLSYEGLVPPYDPSESFPEYSGNVSKTPRNTVFAAIRASFEQLGYDHAHFGSPQWSPLRFLVKPQSRVIVKPAMTTHVNISGDSIFAIIPHGSVIRAVLEYIVLAGPETVTVADGPIPNTDFREVVELMGLEQIAETMNRRFGREVVRLLDLRDEYSPKDTGGEIIDNIALRGDPLGYENVDIGQDSDLAPLDAHWTRYRSVSSHEHERFAPPVYHSNRRHVYSIPKSILQSDVIINISKLKTHRKVGLTCALKNVVGITNRKYWLPHFRAGIDGSYLDGMSGAKRLVQRLGDMLRKAYFTAAREKVRALEYPCSDGNWPGDDTTWRMVRDLYRIMLYADSMGELCDEMQRRHFAVIDGVVGGAGFGPLAPRKTLSRTLIMGINPRSTDAVAAYLMGYEPASIPLLVACGARRYPLTGECEIGSINVVGNESKLVAMDFARPVAWRRFPRPQGGGCE